MLNIKLLIKIDEIAKYEIELNMKSKNKHFKM